MKIAAEKLIDGKQIRDHHLALMTQEVEALKAQGVEPALAVIIVGQDPASRVYVNNKKAACARIGVRSVEYALPEETTTEELLALIDQLNADASINGILCQLPVPRHIDESAVLERILPAKDVDCFHPVNVGLLSVGKGKLMPCTPMGVMQMLKYQGVDPAGMHCVVLGRSNIVGKPMAMLLLASNATVTVCHSRTRDLPSITRQADLLVAAVGKPKFVTADMVKDGAIVIDVGMDRDENGIGIAHVDLTLPLVVGESYAYTHIGYADTTLQFIFLMTGVDVGSVEKYTSGGFYL